MTDPCRVLRRRPLRLRDPSSPSAPAHTAAPSPASASPPRRDRRRRPRQLVRRLDRPPPAATAPPPRPPAPRPAPARPGCGPRNTPAWPSSSSSAPATPAAASPRGRPTAPASSRRWRSGRRRPEASPSPTRRMTLDGWWLSRRATATARSRSSTTAATAPWSTCCRRRHRRRRARLARAHLRRPRPGRRALPLRPAFRPDWEAVITPVVDFALREPGVDPKRVALIGVSQAGYWVPRAAAFEPRLAAAVADPGVTRVWSSWLDNFPRGGPRPLPRRRQGRPSTPRWPRAWPDAPARLRFDLAKRREPYRIASFFDIVTEVRTTTSPASPAASAARPWSSTPRTRPSGPASRSELFAALACPKTLMPFTAAEGADGHCEPMAPALRNARVFDWLEATLA